MKEIIKNNRLFIRSIIRKMLGNYNEDIEQEVYIQAWKSSDTYKEEGKHKNWLAVITKNKCRDYIKSSLNRVFANSEELDEERVSDNKTQERNYELKERQKIILKEIYNLPKDMSKIVIFYEFEDMSYEQIAKKLGVTVPTVKNKLFKARKILADKLKFLKGNDYE